MVCWCLKLCAKETKYAPMLMVTCRFELKAHIMITHVNFCVCKYMYMILNMFLQAKERNDSSSKPGGCRVPKGEQQADG